MSPEVKYQTARSGKKLKDGFLLPLAILAFAALGWIWWRSGRVGHGAGARGQESVVRGQKADGRGVAPESRSADFSPLPSGPREVAGKRTEVRAPLASSPPVSTAPGVRDEGRADAGVAHSASAKEASTAVDREITSCLPAAVQRVLGAQVALVRLGISAGSLDGLLGSQTRAALRAYSRKEGRTLGIESNAIQQLHLSLSEPPLVSYVITGEDLARLLPLGTTWLSKSQQARLDFETILELAAEKSQAHPNLIRRLNPGIDWNNVAAGTSVIVPNAAFPPVSQKAAFIRIFLEGRALEAFDQETNLLAHFPCSIAQRVEKRPVGELRVAVVAPNPNYTFDPEVFPESAEARELGRKLILPPGPNNPVGVVWIGLDKPGYGIHGTPRPEDVGRTESHGCFRLANWNAEYLLRLITIGTPVVVEP